MKEGKTPIGCCETEYFFSYRVHCYTSAQARTRMPLVLSAHGRGLFFPQSSFLHYIFSGALEKERGGSNESKKVWGKERREERKREKELCVFFASFVYPFSSSLWFLFLWLLRVLYTLLCSHECLTVACPAQPAILLENHSSVLSFLLVCRPELLLLEKRPF